MVGENVIGNSGTEAIAEMLKTNTSVTTLLLGTPH